MSPSEAASIGIDVGEHGGLSVLVGRSSLLATGMPYRMVGTVWLPDGPEIVRRITDVLPPDMPAFVTLEHVFARYSNGAISLGRAQAVVIDRLVDLYPVHVVGARTWQKALGVHHENRMERKERAIEHVKRHWPGVNLAPGRCTTPQSGIADAVCLAEYGQSIECGVTLEKRRKDRPVKRRKGA